MLFVSPVSKFFLTFLHSGNFNQIKLFQMTFNGGVHRPPCQCWALMRAWIKRTKFCLGEKTNDSWTGYILLLASSGLQVPQEEQKVFNHLTIATCAVACGGLSFTAMLQKEQHETLLTARISGCPVSHPPYSFSCRSFSPL